MDALYKYNHCGQRPLFEPATASIQRMRASHYGQKSRKFLRMCGLFMAGDEYYMLRF